MQKDVNLIDLAKRFPTNIWVRKSASIQPRPPVPSVFEDRSGIHHHHHREWTVQSLRSKNGCPNDEDSRKIEDGTKFYFTGRERAVEIRTSVEDVRDVDILVNKCLFLFRPHETRMRKARFRVAGSSTKIPGRGPSSKRPRGLRSSGARQLRSLPRPPKSPTTIRTMTGSSKRTTRSSSAQLGEVPSPSWAPEPADR